jgi:hypothetical protein
MKPLMISIAILLIANSASAGTWIDDFSRRGDWQVIGDNSQWVIKDGELLGQWEPPFQSHFVTHIDAPWKDYTVSCKVKFVKLHDPLNFMSGSVSLGVRQQWNKPRGNLEGAFFTVSLKGQSANFVNLYDGNLFDTQGEKWKGNSDFLISLQIEIE